MRTPELPQAQRDPQNAGFRVSHHQMTLQITRPAILERLLDLTLSSL